MAEIDMTDLEPAAPDETLDALGLCCPVPVWETAKRVRSMAPGRVIEVLSDDDGVEEDFPAWCARTGNALLALTQEDGVYRALIRKT